MRRSLGVAVVSGMLGVTGFGIFLTPVFYYVISKFTKAPVATHEAGEHGAAAQVAAAKG
jgi:hypothetical protein